MDSKLIVNAIAEMDQDLAQVRAGIEKMSHMERTMLYFLTEGKFKLAFQEKRVADIIIYRLALTQLATFILSIEQEKM